MTEMIEMEFYDSKQEDKKRDWASLPKKRESLTIHLSTKTKKKS